MRTAGNPVVDAAASVLASAGRLLRARNGNFGLLAAIALIPIFGAAGLAYDYGNMLVIKTRMSDSLDAAAFEAAELYSKKLPDDKISARAEKIFKSDLQQFGGSNNYSFAYEGAFAEGGTQIVRVSASADYRPAFMPILWDLLGDPSPSLQVTRQSEVSLATSTVELALVLDNSGSMNDNGKIGTLKQAASSLVDDLFSSAARGSADDAVKVAVVPFAGSVNVGPENRGAAWLDMQGISSIHHENFDWTTLGGGAKKQPDGSWQRGTQKLTRFWLYDKLKLSWAGCVEARPAPFDTDNAAPNANNPDTLFVPMFAPDEPDRYQWDEYYYPNSYISDDRSNEFNGKKMGRSNQPDRQAWMDKYDNKNVWRAPGPNEGCTTIPLMSLSTDRKEIQRKLQAMDAKGSTNIPQGVAWGLRTLTPNIVFDGARPFDTERNIKAMVVMTDGENTYYSAGNHNLSTYGAYGYAASGRIHAGTGNAGKYWDSAFTDSMNQHLLAACKTARDQGIMLFTIAFDVKDGSSVKTMLRECASDDGSSGDKLYFDAKDAEDLKTAFGVIGSKIAGLRLYR